MQESYVFSFGNSDTYVYRVGDKTEIVEDPITKRSSKTVIAFREDSRLFSGLALSKSCPYEGRIAYNFIDAIGQEPDFLTLSSKGSKEKEIISATELLSYYINYQASRFKVNKISVVVPKWWDEKRLTALETAAKLADVQINPIQAPLAEAFALHMRYSEFPEEGKTICLINTGATGLDITYSKLETNKITTLMYVHTNLGGEDLTNAFANQLISDLQNDDSTSDEAKELLKQIAKGEKPTQKRIFFEKANTVKEDLTTTTKHKFKPDTSAQIEKDVDYKYFTSIPTIAEYRKFLADIISNTHKKFTSKYPDNKLSSVEILGGNSLSVFIQEIVASIFTSHKMITNFLNKKEALIEGAAHYLRRQELHKINPQDKPEFEYEDQAECYSYTLEKPKYIQKPIPETLIQCNEIPIKESKSKLVYYRIIRPFVDIHLYDLKKKPGKNIEKDLFGKQIIADDIISKNYLLPDDKTYTQYEKTFEKWKQMDYEYEQLGILKNQLQGAYLNIKSYYITKVLNNPEGRQPTQDVCDAAMELHKKYEKEYKKLSDSTSTKELREANDRLIEDVTNHALGIFNTFLGDDPKLSPPKPDDKPEVFQNIRTQSQSFAMRSNTATQFLDLVLQHCKSLVQEKTLLQKKDDVVKAANYYSIIRSYAENIQLSPISDTNIIHERKIRRLTPLTDEQKAKLKTPPKPEAAAKPHDKPKK